jgi:hypothetical protein
MFENFEKIGDEVYLYKNFLSEKQCLKILNVLDNLTEDKWIDRKLNFNSQRTDNLKEMILVRNKINNIIAKDFFLGAGLGAIRLLHGDSWPDHMDNQEYFNLKEEMSLYKDGMPYEEKEFSMYGTIVYLNNFEGGEIYYSKQNIIYKPNLGDLVIHSAGPNCTHGVKPVISEKRYTYSNHIYKKVRVPA